jgi:arylsulfatase
VRFTDFHVSPTCAPTRSALLTGRHEFKNGVTHTIFERERLTPQATTLAQVLKEAGYATGIFGKWHLGDEPEHQPEHRGFDEVFIHGGGGIGQVRIRARVGMRRGTLISDPAIPQTAPSSARRAIAPMRSFAQALRWIATCKDEAAQALHAHIATAARPRTGRQVRPEDAGAVTRGSARCCHLPKYFGMGGEHR